MLGVLGVLGVQVFRCASVQGFGFMVSGLGSGLRFYGSGC